MNDEDKKIIRSGFYSGLGFFLAFGVQFFFGLIGIIVFIVAFFLINRFKPNWLPK